jgi:hypothetical protein
MSNFAKLLKEKMFLKAPLWGFCLFITILTNACAGNYGGIRWDADVTRSFEAYHVQPDYKYYSYYIGMRVFAIVGIDKDLKMQTGIWRDLATDTEDFHLAIDRIWYNDYQMPSDPRGALILDPGGKKVGIYYSSLSLPSIKFMPENQIMIMLDTTVIRGGPGDLQRNP